MHLQTCRESFRFILSALYPVFTGPSFLLPPSSPFSPGLRLARPSVDVNSGTWQAEPAIAAPRSAFLLSHKREKGAAQILGLRAIVVRIIYPDNSSS
jgi:hypothetical protein